MLYKQAGLYFKGTRQKRKPSGIDLYCTRGGKTQQDSDVQNEGDDLLAPDELIKGMEDVLADNDELESNFEQDEEDLFGGELNLFDDELDDDDTLFEIFADDEMVRSDSMPSTSLGDLETPPNNVPATRAAGSIGKDVFEGTQQVELSDKVPKTKASNSSRTKASKTQGPKKRAVGKKTVSPKHLSKPPQVQAPRKNAPRKKTFDNTQSKLSFQASSKEAKRSLEQGALSFVKRPLALVISEEESSGSEAAKPKKRRYFAASVKGKTTQKASTTKAIENTQELRSFRSTSTTTNKLPFMEGSKSGTTSQSAALVSSSNQPKRRTRSETASKSVASGSSRSPANSKTDSKSRPKRKGPAS